MSQYCLIENGVVIDGPRALPQSWGQTSGFDRMSDPELKALGWLPYININNTAPEEFTGDTVRVITEDSVTDTTSGRSPTTDEFTQIKAQIWEAIKITRDTKKSNDGYQVGDKRYHSDDSSRIQQIGLVIMGNNIPNGLQWKTMDGTFIAMTPTLAQQIFGAAAAKDMALFTKAETLKAQVNAAADPRNIDIVSGWPT